jgi:hypothetical protein
MDSKSARRLKQKLGIATEILMWELSDMWGHVSAKAGDGERFFIQHLRPRCGKVSLDHRQGFDGDRARATSSRLSNHRVALLRATDQKRTALEPAIAGEISKPAMPSDSQRSGKSG